MIRITKSSEPVQVQQLVAVIYSPPGLGKSTLGFTADRPLLLDFDGGAYRAGIKGDLVQVSEWQDVAAISRDDLRGYKTVVVDTVGRALDILSADIIRRNPKMGRGGALTLQGYGQLKAEFTAWTKLLRSFGVDIVLLAHSSEDKSGDDIIERIDVQGGSKGEVYKVADLMGRLSIQSGKRVLNFSPTETAFGKNPAALDAIAVPDYRNEPKILAEIIQQTKDRLNELSAEQQELMRQLNDWNDVIGGCESADDFLEVAKRANEADLRVRRTVKGLLLKRAKERGFSYDKTKGQFVEAA